MFNEFELSFALVPETWLVSGRTLERNVADLELGEEISIIHKNRGAKKGGGVAILFNKSKCRLGEYKMPGNLADVVAAVGKFRGDSRKVLVVCAYLPPNMKAATLKSTLESVSE